jgi:hypothetical protein
MLYGDFKSCRATFRFLDKFRVDASGLGDGGMAIAAGIHLLAFSVKREIL